MRLVLVRHGKTLGNTLGRYIGTTDEPLCQEGRDMLLEGVEKGCYPKADLVFSSPLRRCLETADILYPGQEPVVLEGFRECDFGAFENKNYQELSGNPDYQAWIDSNGTLPFPGGESREQVAVRVAESFGQMLEICEEKGISGKTAALIVHGGTIMSLMEQFGRPKKDYFDWQVKNGQGFLAEAERKDGTVVISVGVGISP